MKSVLLIINGVLNALLCALHIGFWKLFDWPASLSSLSKDNRAVLEILNIVSIWMILYFTVMSFWLARKTVYTSIEKSIFILIAGFYLIRLVLGYPYFGISIEEIVVWVVCVFLIIGNLLPVFQSKKG